MVCRGKPPVREVVEPPSTCTAADLAARMMTVGRGFFLKGTPMKKFWSHPKFRLVKGDLFTVMSKIGPDAETLADAFLRSGFVQADDIFQAWRDENGKWWIEHVKRLGWGHGVSPSLPSLPGPYCPGPHELLCFSENCSESGECRRFGVRLDNTLHK